MQVYSPDSDSWCFKQPMPFPQRSIAASTLNGRIYVIGGPYDTKYEKSFRKSNAIENKIA